MKANIHPKYYSNCKVTCACGNTFIVGAGVPQINVEVCSKCHPFYTGQMKFVDTAGRVEKFRAKMTGRVQNVVSKAQKRKLKREKKIKEEMDRPDTLAALRTQVKGNR